MLEGAITLEEARKLIPGNPSKKTLLSWCKEGFQGVILYSVKFSHTRFTTLEAVEKFKEEISKLQNQTSDPLTVSKAHKERIERMYRRLDELYNQKSERKLSRDQPVQVSLAPEIQLCVNTLELAPEIQPCADAFKALSDKLRFSVFIQIANSEHGLTMTALAGTMKMNKATVHQALKTLHRAKLIEIVSLTGNNKVYKSTSRAKIHKGSLVIACETIQIDCVENQVKEQPDGKEEDLATKNYSPHEQGEIRRSESEDR